jgi:hypothetical protein
VSNVNRVGLPAAGGSPAGGAAPSGTAPRLPTIRPPAPIPPGSIPNVEGTAILNLTSEQVATIRQLLMGMRYGKNLAADVRGQIFALLTKGQRRVLGAAWFILSVRA